MPTITSTRSISFKKRPYRLRRFPHAGAPGVKANGQYAEGTTWEIPEHELDRALATHRKQDASFRQRIKKAAMYLSPADAEAIIRLATYGIVRLELVIPPVPVREKPYYL